MAMMLRLVWVLGSVALAGCALFANEAADGGLADATIDTPNSECDARAIGPLLNPQTLECDFAGNSCSSRAPLPPWGRCGGPCDAMPEPECLSAAECRAAYDHACFTGEGECTALTPFLGCFPISQFGTPTQDCVGLDSWGCSNSADCIALHTTVCSGDQCWREFVACENERR